MAAAGSHLVDLQGVFDRFHDLTKEQARVNVFFAENDDAWQAGTQCVWDAAFCAGLIGGFIFMEWPTPEDLHEQWAWFQEGHWPCGYADVPSLGSQPMFVL